MSKFVNVFDGVEETIQKKRVKAAGVYRKCKLTSAELIEQDADEEKKKKAYKCLLLKFNIPIENDDVAEYEHRIFQPPTQEKDVKFCMKHYVKGIAVRDNTPLEQIYKDHEIVSIELIQLIQSFGNTFEQAKGLLTPFVSNSEIETAFVDMSKGFCKLYADGHTNLIDIKFVVYNSDKNKTSQLQIASPTTRNLAYCNHLEGVKSKLEFSDYELKSSMVFKYTGKENPPSGTDPLLTDTSANLAIDEFDEFKPNPNSTVSDDPLF
jgi:hypothetical protein